MSLACLTCQAIQRTHSDVTACSLSSQEEQSCGPMVGCWSKKNPRQQPRAEGANAVTVSTRVAPVPSGSNINTNQGSVSPRLTRCHAVRRDILRDWNFEDFVEGSRLCLT